MADDTDERSCLAELRSREDFRGFKDSMLLYALENTAQQFSGNRVGYGDARHTVSWLSELSSVILRRVQRAWVSSSSAPL